MRSRSLAIPALAAAVAVPGCGGKGEGPNAKNFSGEQKKVARVVDDLSADARSGDTKDICRNVFTPQLAASVGRKARTSCEAKVRGELVADDERITITQLAVQAPNAIAQVQEQNGNVSRLTFIKQDGTWHINSIQ